MKNMKGINKMSLLALGTTVLTFVNMNQSNAQTTQAQTTNKLNLRNGASTKDTVMLTLKKGTNVDILDSLGEWSKIKYKNNIGYVSSQYLKKLTNQDNISSNENKVQPDKVKIMECGVNFLNIRFGPSSSEKILGTIKKGDKVEIIYEVNNTWARIKYNGSYGYVNMQYLTSINSNTIINKSSVIYCNTPISSGNKYDFMRCKVDLLNIRSGPSSSEKIIGQLEKNDLVEVVYHVSTGWTKIKYAHGYAYVNTNHLYTA